MLDSELEVEEERRPSGSNGPNGPITVHPLVVSPSGLKVKTSDRHSDIDDVMKIDDDDWLLRQIYDIAINLCDPFTQPEESEEQILSLNNLADIFIGLSYLVFKREYRSNGNGSGDELAKNPDIMSIRFELSLQFFKILLKVHRSLNADDELKLRYMGNGEDDWFDNLELWTPVEEISADENNMNLCYSLACLLLISIYKLFQFDSSNGYNLSLNPYLQHFIKLWKCHTNIILLGLEIDRRLEMEETEETLYIIKQVLKGSSSVRYVLAWIINQNPSLILYEEEQNTADDKEALALDDMNHDIREESLINFIQPLVRKKVNGGSLLIDMRLVIIALFITNSGMTYTVPKDPDDSQKLPPDAKERIMNQKKPIAELGDLLIDLEYDDQFDEDIRYIFEYDLEDTDDDWLDIAEEDGKTKATEDKDNVSTTNDTSDKSQEDANDQEALSTAIRSKEQEDHIEFDEQGNDWRDLPRGDNIHFQPWFEEIVLRKGQHKNEDGAFHTSWNDLRDKFEYLTRTQVDTTKEWEEKNGQILLNSISKSIKDEIEKKLIGSSDVVTPDLIYQYWSSSASEDAIHTAQSNNRLIVPIFSITNFELLLHNNTKIARCMMDEMLMCPGYRRVLIWFLTHNINLSIILIDYVFELLVGLRGTEQRQIPYKFTRKGSKVELSDVEKLMLLHEFLTNTSVYLSATEGVEIEGGYKAVLSETVAKKYMTLICLMITQLISSGIIDLERKKNKAREDISDEEEEEEEAGEDIHDYSNDLQVLLINWIGKLPEARELFFRIKRTNYAPETNNDHNQINEKLHEVEEVDYDKLDLLLMEFGGMSSVEILENLRQSASQMSTIKSFADSLEYLIKAVLHQQLDVSDDNGSTRIKKPSQIAKDFETFLQKFNILCKIDFFAEVLFNRFEKLASSGEFDQPKKDSDCEPEFNEQFLNGDCDFDASTNTSKVAKSKKKNKKKKSKKK